ncbi:MAG: double zinc ribbon domain-containing protein, partial [Pyrinomonadaceae bacterium]
MSLLRIANSIYDGALSLLYPQQCVLCGGAVDTRDDGVTCSDCWEQTRIFDGSETACWKCGVEATALARIENRHQVRC